VSYRLQLPHPEQAHVPVEKLVDYCLNSDHPRGRHKARVFAATLGVSSADAEQLRSALLSAAVSGDTVSTESDAYGQRYVLDFPMDGPLGQATVRSAWIVRTSEDFPRLTSCFVL